MTVETRADLERLALALEAEVALATTREAHIRAVANASLARFIIAHAVSESPAA